MKNRIDLKFEELKNKNEKAMIPFITAGDPDFETTVSAVLGMERAGADIIELGIPYSDPIADGPVIQASSKRALKGGAKIKDIMAAVKKIREKSNIPVIYLVYYNSIFRYGMEKFMKECMENGADGLIIPDLPIEERKAISDIAEPYNIDLIPLVAPTSKERIKKIAEGGKGFIYCISVNGVTGMRKDSSIKTNIKKYMELVSSYTDLPKALGFGISNAEMAKEYKDYCDGIIVGSAIVKIMAQSKDRKETVSNVEKFVRQIKESL